MNDFALSDAARTALNDQLAELGKRAGRRLTLEGLIESWEGLVERVETGYADSIYDYLNDLDVRALLQEIVERGPAELRKAMKVVVVPLDGRFRKATRRPKTPLRPGSRGWWLRIPIEPADELRADLVSRGLV